MSEYAHAFWLIAPEAAEIREAQVDARDDQIVVRTLFSGISRGTERLVYKGHIPASEHDAMRAPFQDGSFSFPLKYGYSAVGVIEEGPRSGATVFVLYPHQTRFAIPADAALPIPSDVPPERAILAANMETALNVLWDSGIHPGDRVVVIGAGVVGALVGYLSARMPGTDVCLVDIDATKTTLAKALGCEFALPSEAPTDADLVIHASASSAGLATAISIAGMEASIVEASWYGTQHTTVPLGGAFHQKRLRIVGSQVGRIPAQLAPRWTYQRRLSKALTLLTDPTLDTLISGQSDFEALPRDYGSILDSSTTLCHRIRYSRA